MDLSGFLISRETIPPPSGKPKRDWNIIVFVDDKFFAIVSSWPFPLADDWQSTITAKQPDWKNFSLFNGGLDASRTKFTGRLLCGAVRPSDT